MSTYSFGFDPRFTDIPSKLEVDLEASIHHTRQPLPSPEVPNCRVIRTHSNKPLIDQQNSASETVEHYDLAQLVAGCGVAAIDAYLTMRDYAQSKGLDLIEFHHKGIDLQDLLSTLIIHTQRKAEMERSGTAAARYKR